MRVSRRLLAFIGIVQLVLFLAHFFLYKTWTFSPGGGDPIATPWLKLAFALLSISFVAASLLAFRYTNPVVRVFYRVAALWLGFVSFFFLASVLAWVFFFVTKLAGLHFNFHRTVEFLAGSAALAGLFAVLNASFTRITRASVRLTNLP